MMRTSLPFVKALGTKTFGSLESTRLLPYRRTAPTRHLNWAAMYTLETQGVHVAIVGCGHGELHRIYSSIGEHSKARGWSGVDLVIVNGDFQAVRDAADLAVMAVPAKYRRIGDFYEYYSGICIAPYLTIFIHGNHEASSHLWELYYGGWVAPKIYYMGAANVLRFGPLRIVGLSGIFKGRDYRMPHHERLPFSSDDIRSFYHVRELDTRKLLLLRTQVDVGLSHDWPRNIEDYGDKNWLFNKRPDFRQDQERSCLGSVAAAQVMDRLRPPHWFSAHLHVKYEAAKRYPDSASAKDVSTTVENSTSTFPQKPQENPDEIALEDDEEVGGDSAVGSKEKPEAKEETNHVSDELRAQLPPSFSRSVPEATCSSGLLDWSGTSTQTDILSPPGITNTEVRFLALDKCHPAPRRRWFELHELHPLENDSSKSLSTDTVPQHRLQYDAEWLSICRVFHDSLVVGDKNAPRPVDLGEEHYRPLIDAERRWIEEHVVDKGKLDVPDNFQITAAPYVAGNPTTVQEQPEEHTNPQTAAFCELLGLRNLWHATAEERRIRREQGPPPVAPREGRPPSARGRRGGRGRGRSWGQGKDRHDGR